MASPKQVALLKALFNKAKIYKESDQLDWLYDQGINVDSLEQVMNDEVNEVIPLLEGMAQE